MFYAGTIGEVNFSHTRGSSFGDITELSRSDSNISLAVMFTVESKEN